MQRGLEVIVGSVCCKYREVWKQLLVVFAVSTERLEVRVGSVCCKHREVRSKDW